MLSMQAVGEVPSFGRFHTVLVFLAVGAWLSIKMEVRPTHVADSYVQSAYNAVRKSPKQWIIFAVSHYRLII